MRKPYWIWHPGAFELYHSMLLHNRRTSAKTVEVGKEIKRISAYYPPMWRIDCPCHNAELMKRATVDKEEVIELFSNTEDCAIRVDGKKYPKNVKITLAPGEHTVELMGFKAQTFPAFYVTGDVFKSDRTYITYNNNNEPNRHAGWSELYREPEDNVEIFKFSYKRLDPVLIKKENGGILYDFGKEVFGKIVIENARDGEYLLSLGESYEEALDTEYCQICVNALVRNGEFTFVPVALRYIFVPKTDTPLDIFLDFEYLPLESRASFSCDDELVNRMWNVCKYTMLLNSREGFFDGIKRDRWVWSGDAYQSYFVNYYLAFDKEIVKRTIRMLRGAEPMLKHINTISDYTFYWLCSIWDYYFYTGDKDFVCDIYPDMLSVLSFVEGRLSPDGMFERKPDDWVFMDWSTFDPAGPICAEQMVLCKAYDGVSKCAALVGDEKTAVRAEKQRDYIKEKINERYWCEDKGAFVDDYTTGRENVTRHANIFAILFDLTSEERKKKILENVIYNKEITPITTPYFEFYELDAMCRIGDFKYMTDMLHSYWGAMLDLGATTIWEEFDPTKKGIEHYEMYGGKYEKSLCHAWGASPIYLLGKYALGVYPTCAGYTEYEVKPSLMSFGKIEGTVPTPKGNVTVKMDKERVSVQSELEGGVLVLGDKRYRIEKNKELTVNF
ncbi:MAG: alpha-rhamnosidase [Clostridia bacterium]|nr:alpha-rhamnosidase [Clostridia bacterium]